MKANWIVLINHTGSLWRLVDIYTQREITLPSLDTAAIEPRGPPDSPTYYARDASRFWLDLYLLKVVICEVPTPSEDYMDYKLITSIWNPVTIHGYGSSSILLRQHLCLML